MLKYDISKQMECSGKPEQTIQLIEQVATVADIAWYLHETSTSLFFTSLKEAFYEDLFQQDPG